MDLTQVLRIILLAYFVDWNTVFAENTCPPVDLPNGRARIRSRGRMLHFRCRKNFERVGVRFAVCLPNGQWSQQTPTCVGTTCKKPEDLADLTVEELHKGGMLKFTCKAGLTRKGPETIVCDGKKWSDEPPKCLVGMSLGCDFENEALCGWSQDFDDDFDWTWSKGETPTANTGPQVDHTTNTSEGHYLFMESSAPQKAGHKARLVSPPYPPAMVVNMCLEFFYHMFGVGGAGEVGELDVYIKPVSIKTTMLAVADNVFHRSGDHGDRWVRADLEIPQQNDAFQIVFQSTRRRSWTSDIALDDIRLYNCSDGPAVTDQPIDDDDDNDDNDVDDDDADDEVVPDLITTKAPASRTTKRKRTTQPPPPPSTTTTTTTTTTTPKPTTTPTTTPSTTTTTTTPSTTTTTTAPTTTTTTTTPTTTTPTTTTPSPTTPATTVTPTTLSTKTTAATLTKITTTATDDDDDTTERPTSSSVSSDSEENADTDDDYGDDNDDNDDYDDKDYDNNGDDRDEDDADKSTTGPYIPEGFTAVVDNLDSFAPDDKNDSDSSKIEDYSNNNDNSVTSSVTDDYNNGEGGSDVRVGQIKDPNSSGDTNSDTPKFLPLIIGVVAAVVVGAVVIALLAWVWARNQRRKQEKEQEDQMNIITEYVETNLSI